MRHNVDEMTQGATVLGLWPVFLIYLFIFKYYDGWFVFS